MHRWEKMRGWWPLVIVFNPSLVECIRLKVKTLCSNPCVAHAKRWITVEFLFDLRRPFNSLLFVFSLFPAFFFVHSLCLNCRRCSKIRLAFLPFLLFRISSFWPLLAFFIYPIFAQWETGGPVTSTARPHKLTNNRRLRTHFAGLGIGTAQTLQKSANLVWVVVQ